MNRCAVYARYSSEKQNPLSTAQQVRKCREYAERNRLTVPDELVFADEAISGATDNRAGLQRLLALAQQKPHLFDAVLVDDTSRLSRNMGDSQKILERFKFWRVRVVFVAQGIDTNTDQARSLAAMHGIVDSLYLDDLKKRTIRGLEQCVLDGRHTGGRVFGYSRVPIENPNQTDAARQAGDPRRATRSRTDASRYDYTNF